MSKQAALQDLDTYIATLNEQYAQIWESLELSKSTPDAKLAALARVGTLLIRAYQLKLDAVEPSALEPSRTIPHDAVNAEMMVGRVVDIREVREDASDASTESRSD